MPLIVQISIVLVAVALIALCISAMRAMKRFGDAANELAQAAVSVSASMAQVTAITSEIRGTVHSVREIVTPLQRLSGNIEHIGSKALRLSSTVLDEVSQPVLVALAVKRGVASGISRFTQRMFRGAPSSSNGTAER